MEFYDFLLFGTLAALAFNKLFFPKLDPAVGTIASFGTFTVGYLARPIGGLIIGHFGDRIGRRSMLLATMTTMGLASFLIGVLPSTTRSVSGPRSCSSRCAPSRASRSAANGAARS